MKTSFYFILWILIYPVLGLFHNDFIDNNAFFVAFIVVIALSWALNRLMPNTLTYERALRVMPILEDVYTGNVRAFSKRLSSNALIEIVSAIYFFLTTAVIAMAIFIIGLNDWIALVIFGWLAIGSISRGVKLGKAKAALHSNPTPEECMDIAEEVYDVDYASYYETRQNCGYSELLPAPPRFFKGFQIFSLVMAAFAAILGLLFIVLGIAIMANGFTIESGAVAGMNFLYGMLATYFGVKDFITTLKFFKKRPVAEMPKTPDMISV